MMAELEQQDDGVYIVAVQTFHGWKADVQYSMATLMVKKKKL